MGSDITPSLPVVILVLVAAVIAYQRSSRCSVKHIRGPPVSFWRGNIRDFFYQDNVGDLDFKYAKDYGLVWRLGAPLGEDVLMIADPKVLQHIFHKSGYNYLKNTETLIKTNMLFGSSILYTPSGRAHARHRKVMNPAFSTSQLRSFLPLFQHSADKLCHFLGLEVLRLQGDRASTEGQVVAVNKWLSRATLDIIGETALHYDFGSLENSKSEVSEAYENMFVESRINPSLLDALFRASWKYMPLLLVEFVQYLPGRAYSRVRKTRKIIDRVSGGLVDRATEEAKIVPVEKGKKDVMSVLVRANLSENPSLRLSKKEMVAQMGALTFAGHETTANTLTWMLWELAKHPEFQEMLRTEIREKREEVKAEGSHVDFSVDDLESMPFLEALIKEVMRFHPIIYQLIRIAGQDDTLPLSEPLLTVTGEAIDEIPIAKGQSIMFSICAYNRIKKIWGEDADEFNPMRFIENRVEPEFKVGMYGNLMTFSAGLRSCIGWRFSLIEMQAVITALIERFEFCLPPKEQGVEVLRKPLGIMGPMVKGRLDLGSLLPLNVKPLRA
ncbi:cytochrome P450 [Irpex rosettiformis]|uniref:Cytochrome P450 n=1 Tax=Irpex rosettiformis TaxID=378272 RepID=A0ACB8U3Z6_9APHY|nr:cytochrome P450 [Irpex rosettiformis]